MSLKGPLGAAACVGDGVADDTACIQAHIDYAYNNGLRGVYCPAGTYKITSTVYLDAPGNLRTSLTSPTIFNFTLAFFGDPVGGGWGHYFGCQLQATFNNAVAFMVGTGQSMRVSDIAVVGPDNAYRGNLNSSGVGIGLTGGSGGSSSNLVENTYVANFYNLYMTNANNACCLADHDSFHKVGGSNGYRGIYLYGQQAYINDVIEPDLQNITIGIDGTYDHSTFVHGGFISAGSGASGSFGLSAVGFSGTGCTLVGGQCVTGTIASPDGNVGSVYTAYMVNTPDFGVIPLEMRSFNSSTHVGTFDYYAPWFYVNYGRTGGFAFDTELAAATTIYAAERTFVAQGLGLDLESVHVENPSACSTIMKVSGIWGAQVSDRLIGTFFNYDPSLASTGASQANKYCQLLFETVGAEGGISFEGTNPVFSLEIDGGNWGFATEPVSIAQPTAQFATRGTHLGSATFNLLPWDNNSTAFSQVGFIGGALGQLPPFTNHYATVARGFGRWDYDYFLPSVVNGNQDMGDLTAEYCGYEPCPGVTPNLSTTLYATVSGSLGALGTYPPIACRTVFKSVDWNTGVVTVPSTVGGGIFKRSASCPGYSWGQNLTNTTTGGTVAWHYGGGGSVVYLDATTMTFMFPGLGISLNNGSGAVNYIVTGVYPSLGYVSVVNATTNAGNVLAGTAGTVYSCSSSCTIGQASFAWSAY